MWERRSRPTEALRHAQQSLELFRVVDHQRGQAYALNAVGWCHALLGDHQQAIIYCRQAHTQFQALDDRHGQAATWRSIGYAQHHLGHHTDAITSYHHALHYARYRGDRYYEAEILTRLGNTHHTMGNHRAARDGWQHALTILEGLNHPDADQLHTKLTTLNTSNSIPKPLFATSKGFTLSADCPPGLSHNAPRQAPKRP